MKRWRDCSRAAWDMIVGGAKSERPVSTVAPTAWPDSLSSPISACTSAKVSTGSSLHTGSEAHIAATLLPRAPRSVSARTETGTMALSVSSSVGKARSRSQRPSASETTLSTTSLIVPPRTFLIALKRSSSASTQSKRRWGEIDTFSGVLGAGLMPPEASAPTAAASSTTRRTTRRGPRSTARAPRTISVGRVARSTSASPSSWASLGNGRATHGRSGGAGGGASGAASNSTVVMSTPEMPSTRAWWVLASRAKRSPSSLSTSQISHSGLSRSSCCENTRPARFFSCCSEPGRGSAVWRTW